MDLFCGYDIRVESACQCDCIFSWIQINHHNRMLVGYDQYLGNIETLYQKVKDRNFQPSVNLRFCL